MPIAFTKIFTIRNTVIDLTILASIYFIPALSHIAPFPVYLLDPMRVFMLLGYLLTRQNANAYLLAATIPLFSALVTGHPPFFKAVLISIELMANIFIFIQLLRQNKLNPAIALFISIFASKLVYYSMKFFFIKFGMVEGGLITTAISVQIGTMLFLTLSFYLFLISSRRSGKIHE